MQHTGDQTDTQPDERHNDEHQDKGVIGNHSDVAGDPTDSSGDNFGHVGDNRAHGHSGTSGTRLYSSFLIKFLQGLVGVH